MTILERQNAENIHTLIGQLKLSLEVLGQFKIEHETYQTGEKLDAIANYLGVEFMEKEGYRKIVCRKKK